MFVCVCVFVFMHVFANVFGYALLFLFSNVQGCVYVCASLWLCVWESLCVCVWLLCMHECVFVAQRVCVCAVFCQEGKVHGPREYTGPVSVICIVITPPCQADL